MTNKYHISLRILHWLMAIIIFSMIFSGWYMEGMLKTDIVSIFGADYGKYDIYGLHKSFGVMALLLVTIRIIVKLSTKTPPYPKEVSDKNIKLAKLGHWGIYALMFAVPVSGYLMSILGGHGVKFFGYQLPELFDKNKEIGGFFHESHEVVAYILLALIVGHIAAVIKHKRDNINILERMI